MDGFVWGECGELLSGVLVVDERSPGGEAAGDGLVVVSGCRVVGEWGDGWACVDVGLWREVVLPGGGDFEVGEEVGECCELVA